MEGEGRKAKTVCVTGAGGFVASWLVKWLLSTGDYTVHGTVRDPSDPKNGHLRAMDGAGERLRLFKANVLDYASVAHAVAGCDGVFHVASPVAASKTQYPDVEVLSPAVKGTQNVLKACQEAKVRRVVVVSSAAAVIMNPIFPKDAVLDEDAWSDEDYCRNTGMWYCLSKTLAEREALAYAEKTCLDVVTVCPPLVLGPLLQPVVNTSSLVLINLLKGDSDTVDRAKNVVDVRDLADALILVYENAEASGRYICSSYRKRWSEMVDMARSFFPDLNKPKNVSDPANQVLCGCVLQFCVTMTRSSLVCRFVEAENDDRRMSSKKVQALGWKFRTVECLRDSVEFYKAAGFL